MKRLNNFLFVIGFFILSTKVVAQTKEDLKKQKLEIEKEILYTTDLLKKNRSSKTKSLNYLKVLKSQIKAKEELLITLNIEISLLTKQIKRTEYNIRETENKILQEKEILTKLKEEYSKMIYAANKQKGSRNDIIFIVSSTDFNQAYKRVLYLKQYSSFRKNQVVKIEESKNQLIKKKEKLAQQKDGFIEQTAVKTLLISSKKSELKSVNSTKKEKIELLKELSKSEKLFKKDLQEKQNKAKALNQKIKKIIEEEIEKAKRKNNNHNLTPELEVISLEFTENKGKLPWPLLKGLIIGRYGKQQHVVFAGVETFNNGVDIATDKNADVRCVFDGTVSRIFFIKGEGKAILINHGEYFSVYSGLKEVKVKVGEKLLSKEKIGVVLTHEEENKTELHFEIWKGYEKQDPSKWLYNAD